jgi:hypothetical protein
VSHGDNKETAEDTAVAVTQEKPELSKRGHGGEKCNGKCSCSRNAVTVKGNVVNAVLWVSHRCFLSVRSGGEIAWF